MTRLFSISLSVCAAAVTLVSVAVAAPVNGDFETANFTGWKLDIPQGNSERRHRKLPAGTANIVSAWGSSHQPVSGSYFAALGTQSDADFSGHRSYDISLSQRFTLDSGDTLLGWSFFYNGDYDPQDTAWVKVFDAGGNLLATPWLESSGGLRRSDPNSTPYRTATPWTQWQWEAPSAGNYTLFLGVTTSGDNNGASFGFFEDICLHAAALPVPEPSALALTILGVTALGARRRKMN
jgi:hypothetical protein